MARRAGSRTRFPFYIRPCRQFVRQENLPPGGDSVRCRRQPRNRPSSFMTHRSPARVAIVCLSVLTLATCALAASDAPRPGTGTGPPPPYAPLRQMEDYSYLRDPARRTDLFDPIKFIPLNA